MSEELNLCDCGAAARISKVRDNTVVDCVMCGASTGYRDTLAKAVEVWNRRSTSGAASGEVPEFAPDTSQEWAKLDGTTAFHLIERHADDWAETGRMMESWLHARMEAATPAEQSAPPVPRKPSHDQAMAGYAVAW